MKSSGSVNFRYHLFRWHPAQQDSKVSKISNLWIRPIPRTNSHCSWWQLLWAKRTFRPSRQIYVHESHVQVVCANHGVPHDGSDSTCTGRCIGIGGHSKNFHNCPLCVRRWYHNYSFELVYVPPAPNKCHGPANGSIQRISHKEKNLAVLVVKEADEGTSPRGNTVPARSIWCTIDFEFCVVLVGFDCANTNAVYCYSWQGQKVNLSTGFHIRRGCAPFCFSPSNHDCAQIWPV